MWFLVILNALAKNISRSFAKNLFSRKLRKGEWARDVTKEGGSGGASPPAFTRTPSPPKARAKQFSFFWSIKNVKVKHMMNLLQSSWLCDSNKIEIGIVLWKGIMDYDYLMMII